MNLLVSSKKSLRIAKRTNKALLSERISHAKSKRVRIVDDINAYESRLKQLLIDRHWTRLEGIYREAQEKTIATTKRRQKTKFERLRQVGSTSEAPPTLDRLKVVINLISRTLTPIEEEILALGMNFAMAPSRILVSDIIADTEANARYVDSCTAKHLRAGVAKALGSSKPPSGRIGIKMTRS